MLVYINKEGFLKSPDILDATIPMEVSEDTWDIISYCKNFHNWKYENGNWTQVCINNEAYLRKCRTIDCFNILDNRSLLWYNSLTEEQLEELNKWYQDWLNVTDTKIIPETPSWLK